MRLFDFGLFLLVGMFVFGMGYQMQSKADLCKEIDYKSKKCKVQKKVKELGKCCSL